MKVRYKVTKESTTVVVFVDELIISDLTLNVTYDMLIATWRYDAENSKTCGNSSFSVQLYNNDILLVDFDTTELYYRFLNTLIACHTFRVEVRTVTETGTIGDPLVDEYIAGNV